MSKKNLIDLTAEKANEITKENLQQNIQECSTKLLTTINDFQNQTGLNVTGISLDVHQLSGGKSIVQSVSILFTS